MLKKSSYAWVVLTGISLVNFSITGIIFNPQSMYIAPILEAFPSFSRSALTLSLTVQNLVTCVMLFTAGRIVARIGVRKMLMIGCACAVLNQLLMSAATSLPVFYLAYGLFGAAVGLCSVVAAPVLIGNWFAKRNGALIGVAATAMSLGGLVFSPLIGSWIDGLGYRTSLRICAGIVFVLCAIACIIIRNQPSQGVMPLWYDTSETDRQKTREDEELSGMTLKQAYKSYKLYFLALSIFLFAACSSAIMNTMSIFATDHGMNNATIGIILSAYSIVNMVMQVPTGALCDKFGGRGVFISGTGVFILAVVLMLNIRNLPLSIMFVVGGLIGYAFLMLLVPVQLTVRDIFGNREYASMLGIISAASALGSASGTPLLQAVYDTQGSYYIGFIACICIIIISMVMMLVASRENIPPSR